MEDKQESETQRLQEQLRQKTVELAKISKKLDDTTRLIGSIREQIRRIKEKPESMPWRLEEMNRILSDAEQVTGRTFELQMDELNQQFYKVMMEQFPELTSHDLRLCAYIRTGMDSKEIADLMEIKPSSIYITRSRLRKKLGLQPEDDLYGFLTALH
ncbi:MAG TPA: hypothetical protein DEQ34_13785 [Balneolaceae bacterium]|nr:hypothetical protein [Balneolaceae bacterium]|tara:strand:- start:27000 stop:27470 length:471 start_codon:yes stop_codon:yes gene_type:complete